MRRLMSCVAAAVAALAIASTAEASPWRSASTLDGVDASPAMTVGFGCKIIDRKLVCGKDVDDDDDDDKNDGGGANKQKNKDQEQKKQGNICAGEVACPPGYVVLDKPNKYGACCEPKEGFCPPDRPSGTPPNCCAEGTTFREGHCYPTNCPPGTVGTPPHCQRTCGPGKVLVDQTCYDPCPAGTTGTPPNCFCPAGQDWDAGAKACKPRPAPKKLCWDGSKVDAAAQCPPEPQAEKSKKKKKQTLEEMLNEHYPNRACYWDGTAPFCDGECKDPYRDGQYPSKDGKGMPPNFGEACVTGHKVYCCKFGP